MISTNYSVNSIGFRGFLNTRRSLTSAAKEAVKMAETSSNLSKSTGCKMLKGGASEVSSNVSQSSGCILKAKSSNVAEKLENGVEKKGLLKTGIKGPIY